MISNFNALKLALAAFSTTLLLATLPAAAQVTVSVNTKVRACDDFFTNELGDPVDMSNADDISNFITSDVTGLNSLSFSNGVFSAIPDGANTGAFYLLSPQICGVNSTGGRYGSPGRLNTAKYTSYSIRMNSTQFDPGGMKLIWNRDCDYVPNRSVTGLIKTRLGNHVYTMDLNTSGIISVPESSNTSPWSAGSVNGFAIQPTQIVQQFGIDYVRLEDPSSCGTGNAAIGFAANGDDTLYSVWIDDDSNPFNGFYRQIVTAGSAAANPAISALGLAPANYKLVAVAGGDYATLERTDPWDFSDSTDTLLLVGTSGVAAGGVLSGKTTAPGDAAIYLRLSNPIDTSKYSKVSIKIDRSDNAPNMALFFRQEGQGFAGLEISKVTNDPDNNNVYEVDLAGKPGWTGQIIEFVLRPTTVGNVSFNLDFVTLRAAGFRNSLTDPSTQVVASTGNFTVNAPPIARLQEPNMGGGVAIRPWNSNPGDFPLLQNLTTNADPAFPAEPLTCYLPDVRTFQGVRGDFFKGTNITGNDDPVNWSTFPQPLGNGLTFDSAFKNFCLVGNIDKDFDLCLGSVGRLAFQISPRADFSVSRDIPMIYNRWSGTRWYEYCLDMQSLALVDPASAPFNGLVTAFRFDMHEFHRAVCGAPPTGPEIAATYYIDSVKLRKDDASSTGTYSLVYDLTDPDDSAQVSFFYSVDRVASGDDPLIGTVSEGASRVFQWNTAGVPAGSYFVYAVADDGRNTVTQFATGKVTINGPGATVQVPPTLVVERPTEGQVVCDSLQAKGFALQTDRFEDVSAVEVTMDGQLLGTLFPRSYSNAAKAAFPNADSSNTGFDSLFGIGGFGLGAHTVQIKAFGSDGSTTTQSFNVTRAPAGCAAPASDAPPAGQPLGVGSSIPAPEPPTSAPTLRGSLKAVKKNGRPTGAAELSLQIGDLGAVGCTMAIFAGGSASTATTPLKTFTIVQTDIDKGGVLKLKSKALKIAKKKVPRIFLAITKTCAGFAPATSSVLGVRVPTTAGAKQIGPVVTKLSRTLNRVAPQRRRKARRR